MAPHPAILVLNGASSSGKTLTAQCLAERLDPRTVLTGWDELVARVRPFGPETAGGWARGPRILWFQLSGGRLRLFRRLHREVLAHYQAGNPVIVETAFMDPRALRDAAACFAALPAYLIGLKPPLAVSEQWEAQRGDRPRGQARRHYEQVHAHGIYDLLLDPSTLSPAACAAAILARLEGPPPDAFRRLAGL